MLTSVQSTRTRLRAVKSFFLNIFVPSMILKKLYINPFGITLGELCLDLSAEQQSPIFGGLAAGVIGQAVEFA